MKMELFSVTDPVFSQYGQVLRGYDFSSFLERLRKTPLTHSVVYTPSDKALEEDAVCAQLGDRYFGGMPVQIGRCNGVNAKLNCLEYHRDSEVNIAADDCILLLAKQEEISGGLLDTAVVKAFFMPAGTAVELFATALHYAPCSAKNGAGFRVAVVLSRGTNTEKPVFTAQNREDTLLAARNKWLLAHPDSPEAKGGAVIGLTGENLDLTEVLW